jgi:hypothetical protein
MAITEKDLAAALLAAVQHMHPVYGSTTTWHGGIGGQTMTQGCSFIDPPPDNRDSALHIVRVLNAWMREHDEDYPDLPMRAAHIMAGEVRG